MIERDVIHAQSCYQENGEKVRREETRKEVRPQGRRQEGDAQGRGEEGLREEGHGKKDSGEEVCRQEGRGEKIGRQTRAGEAKENRANAHLWIVGSAAGRLIGLRVPAYWLIRRGCRRCRLA
jgi:hypothetical protein